MIPGTILTALRALPWRWIAAAALLAAAYVWIDGRAYDRGVASQAPKIAALERTITEVRNASAAALASDLAHARDTEQQQTKVSDDASTDYQRQLADLRARYQRLLADAAPADPRGGAGAGLPGLPDAAGRPDAAAAQDGLPRADALIASEQALQLQALQGWVRAQAAIDRTKGD